MNDKKIRIINNKLINWYNIRIIKKNLEKNSKRGIKEKTIKNNKYNIKEDKNINKLKLKKSII